MLRIAKRLTTPYHSALKVVLTIFPFLPEDQRDIPKNNRWQYLHELKNGEFFCYEHQFSVVVTEDKTGNFLEIKPQWQGGYEKEQTHRWEKAIATLHDEFTFVE